MFPPLPESPKAFYSGSIVAVNQGIIDYWCWQAVTIVIIYGAFLKTTRIPGSRMSAVSPWALAKA